MNDLRVRHDFAVDPQLRAMFEGVEVAEAESVELLRFECFLAERQVVRQAALRTQVVLRAERRHVPARPKPLPRPRSKRRRR